MRVQALKTSHSPREQTLFALLLPVANSIPITMKGAINFNYTVY